MARGLAALNGGPSDYEAAVEAFTQMTAAAPRFAEGWNKRATAYHLMQRNREAIEDCRATLQLNPMHFGAAAGMGMCCAAVKDYPGALAAFQNALEINPRLGHLRHHITQLQAIVQDQRGE
jgi:tetratricopeptide (TPR) repeat protein